MHAPLDPDFDLWGPHSAVGVGHEADGGGLGRGIADSTSQFDALDSKLKRWRTRSLR